jgi:hypothetical protein
MVVDNTAEELASAGWVLLWQNFSNVISVSLKYTVWNIFALCVRAHTKSKEAKGAAKAAKKEGKETSNVCISAYES